MLKVVPAAGHVWQCACWETRCVQPQGARQYSDLTAKEEVSKKKKRKRKENKKTYPPVPVLQIGVLTGW